MSRDRDDFSGFDAPPRRASQEFPGLEGVFVDDSDERSGGEASHVAKASRSGKPRRVASSKRRRKTSVFGEIVGLMGEFLVTAGAFLMLFVVWQLFWTDVVADADTDQVVAEMQQSLAGGDDTGWVDVKKKKLGDAFAIIRIPRFGRNYAKPIREGTERPILMRGVGHYKDSADPGEIGNFAVAGHRTTYGKPFNRIAELKKGDKIIIETKETFFVYEIASHEIVLPKNGEVVWPVPWEPGVEPTEAMITMTSCHPEFRSIERYVQHGKLVDQFPNNGKLPEEYFLEVK